MAYTCCSRLRAVSSQQVEENKAVMAQKLKRAADASFIQLLPAAKQRRLEEYCKLPKVHRWITEGKEVVPCFTEQMFERLLLHRLCCALCLFAAPVQKSKAVNLEQRPGCRPIAGYLLPTLLRGSSMFLIKCERPLIGKDRLHVQGGCGCTHCSDILHKCMRTVSWSLP